MSIVAFLDYLSLERHYSSHTVLAYGKDIECFSAFAKAEFDQVDLETIQYTQIRSWIVHLVDEGISNTSINRKIASLKSYYKFLLKIEGITVSPLAKHRALKMPKKMQVPFSMEEVDGVVDLLKEATDFESLRDLAIVELLYSTGMRRAELIGLSIGSVNFEQQTVKVLGKRNKERIIPLLPGLAKTVNRYLSVRQEFGINSPAAPLLITQKGVKLYDTLVYRIINRYFSRTSSKLKKSPHIIRHSFATHLLNQGADLNVVKELLGHASLASTQVYTHTSIAALKDVYGAAHPRNKK
ncbi:MAG: integrase/recombinase XerC [Flavobacteriales bacterium]|jgi:integrase/recombinase XerC